MAGGGSSSSIKEKESPRAVDRAKKMWWPRQMEKRYFLAFAGAYTQWCIFLSQEVRENRGHFVPLTARLRPTVRATFTREIQSITQIFTPLSK